MTDEKTTAPKPPQPAISRNAPSDENGFAIASLILGILSITGFGFLLGIPAIILGILALKNPVGRGYSITGIITGTISTIISLALVALLIIGFALSGAPEREDYRPDPGFDSSEVHET